MRGLNTMRTVALLVAGAGLGVGEASAVVCVDASDGSCQATVQAGVDAADPGETIQIARGVYFENVVIPSGKDGIKLKGESRGGTILDGDAPNTGDTLEVGSNGVTITNLTLRNGQGVGVSIQGGTDTALKSVTISGPESGCVAGAGDRTVIESSQLRGCISGVLMSGDDVRIVGNTVSAVTIGLGLSGADALVEDNEISRASAAGISIVGAAARVSSNTISQAQIGITVDGAGSVVRKNFVTGGQSGISVTGDGFDVSKNAVTEMFSSAFFFECGTCAGASASANVASGVSAPDGPAVEVEAGSAGLVLSGMQVAGAAGVAILLKGTAPRLDGARVTASGGIGVPAVLIESTGGIVENSTANGSGGDGFAVVDGDRNTLRNNSAKKNGGDGFDVQSGEDNTLQANKATKNDGIGFEVSEGAEDTNVTNNTAAKNRASFCNEGSGTTSSSNAFPNSVGQCAVGD